MKYLLKMICASCLLLMLSLMLSMITVEARHKQEQASDSQTQQASAPSAITLQCPKCQGAMEQGFLLDQQGYNANSTDTKWIQGAVTKRHFPFTGPETKVQRSVDSYRCTKCGYLELYAR